jgi:hypothetical protein
MVIYKRDFQGIVAFPTEYETPLIIDTDAVVTFQIALESLQAIARRSAQVYQGVCSGEHIQLTQGGWDDIGRDAPHPVRRSPVIKVFGCQIAEG